MWWETVKHGFERREGTIPSTYSTQNETLAKYKYFLDFMFPENLLDYFEPVRMEEKPISVESQIGLDELYQSELHSND